MNNSPYPLFLILIVVIAAALFLGNSDPISAATGYAEASALLADVPAAGWIADKFLSTLFSIVLSGIVLGIAGLGITQGRKWLRNRQFQKPAWKSGPNANWQQNAPKQPKPMSTEQMMQMALLQRLMPTQTTTPQMPMLIAQQQADDDLDLRF